jgi:hypothetical protein
MDEKEIKEAKEMVVWLSKNGFKSLAFTLKKLIKLSVSVE